MSRVGLVADSTAGLTEQFVEEHRIRVIPLYVKIGEQTYRDGVDITPDEFYAQLPHANPLPTTSQPSVGDFVAVYQELENSGATAIISTHLSAEISGTINSATLAAQQIGIPVEIVDTRCAAAAHCLGVEATADALEAGASFEEAVQVMRRAVEQQRTLFLVDTLEYLYKGGRIGGAAALLGSLLQFKPLLYFEDGRIEALERVRKSSRALARLTEVMEEWVGAKEPVRMVIMHADAYERAEALRELLRDHLNITDIQITPLTPVLGTHVGNGTVGACCCPVRALSYTTDGGMS